MLFRRVSHGTDMVCRGTIPPQLFTLKRLSFIYLDINNLTGTVPDNVGCVRNASRCTPNVIAPHVALSWRAASGTQPPLSSAGDRLLLVPVEARLMMAGVFDSTQGLYRHHYAQPARQWTNDWRNA